MATGRIEVARKQNPDNVNGQLPYADFGYVPGVAQAAQNSVSYVNPHLNPQPYFSQAALAAANWFTTRVHLSPLGSALNDPGK